MTFLRGYTDYAGRLTDAPRLFHTWTGIGLLASALGNGAYTWAWGRRICANLWIVLLAESGILRKSTSLRIGQGILTESLPETIMASEWSYEGLLQEMANRPGGTLFVSEYRRFFAAISRDYAGGAKELLTDAYDNPPKWTRRTVKGGETEIANPAPSIIAATTQAWFETSLQADDAAGGFLSRLLFVSAEERGNWTGIGATRSDADHHLREGLGAHLKRVRSEMRGELDISAIKEPFNEWLRAYEESWLRKCIPELAGTIARTGANALKLTMIMQADMEAGPKLTLKAFESARAMVEFANKQADTLLSEGLAMNVEARERRRVREAIKKQYPDALPHSDALRNLNISAKNLERHVSTLLQSEHIVIDPITTGAAGGRPGKAYRWLNGARP
jgi:Protein of unknown function (DUF3987)